MGQCPRCSALLPEGPLSFCPNCGAALEAVLPPPPPPVAAPPPAFGAGPPWERRGELGFVPALVDTTRQVLMSPADFFRGMPVDAGVGAPLGYAMIIGYLGIVVASLYQAILRAGLGDRFAGFGHDGPLGQLTPLLQGGVGFVAQIVFAPVVLFVALCVGAGIHHLVLLLLGGAKRGFEATFRVSCYSQAVSVLLLLPICGGVLSFFWWLVVAIVGLAEAHRIGRGTAAIAVLAPIVLSCCCCGGIAGLFFGGIAAALQHAR